jgi:predicted ATPase
VQPVFVGRSEETAVLHRAIESVERGAGSFVHVVGEAGIGKTSLLDVATTELDRRAVPTRAVIADETDRRRRLAVVRALFPEVDWSSERDPVGGAIAAAERLAAPGPAALIADDVHWADEASLDVLRALSRRAGVLGLLVVTAVRPVPASIELDRLGESAQLHGHRLFLEPLDGEQLDLLVERRFGGRPGPHLGGALRETAGNPFLAVELVGALVDAPPSTAMFSS